MSFGFGVLARWAGAVALAATLALAGCGDDDYGIDGVGVAHDLSATAADLTPSVGDGGTTD